ncbi:MAG: tail fiber assembly protein [Ewingella sp.]
MKLKSLGKFERYTPDEPQGNANYLRNEDGTDWYSISWDKARTAKNIYVMTTDNGDVVCATDRGALLFPADMTVWEMSKGDAPADILTEGYRATIIDGKYTVNYVAIAEAQRNSLLNTAKNKIITWQTKLAIGRKLTDAEKSELNAWLDYIDALDAIDTSLAPDIEWPTSPSRSKSE